MRTKVLAICSALMFTVAMTGMAFAEDCASGTVKSVDGQNVVVDCGGKDVKATGDAKVGDKVAVKDGKVVKAAKKKTEGC